MMSWVKENNLQHFRSRLGLDDSKAFVPSFWAPQEMVELPELRRLPQGSRKTTYRSVQAKRPHEQN